MSWVGQPRPLLARQSVPADRLLFDHRSCTQQWGCVGFVLAIWTGGALGNVDISIERH
jgi:hypothetical protein